MNKEFIHILIANIANSAIEIQSAMKADKLSYNRKIDDRAVYIYALAKQLHAEIFSTCSEVDEEDEEDKEGTWLPL